MHNVIHDLKIHGTTQGRYQRVEFSSAKTECSRCDTFEAEINPSAHFRGGGWCWKARDHARQCCATWPRRSQPQNPYSQIALQSVPAWPWSRYMHTAVPWKEILFHMTTNLAYENLLAQKNDQNVLGLRVFINSIHVISLLQVYHQSYRHLKVSPDWEYPSKEWNWPILGGLPG